MGVYLHWPYCARICPYCDFNVVRDRGRADEAAGLARAIVADLRGQAAITGPRRLVSVFLGGGTPSLMDPAFAAEIIAEARRLWPSDGPVEVTLEANPTDAEAMRFAAFADTGVNRLSLGVQALDDASLALLGRNHDADQARRALSLAGRLFPRLSLDLIYALPAQTPDGWRRTLEEAVDFGPEHLSPYQLTIERGTAFDRAVRRGSLTPPGPDPAADLYDETQATLQRLGFDAYEVSNHARGEGARSRHNLVAWRGEDYVGAGPGAHGRLTLQGARTATIAHRRITDYVTAVDATGVGWVERETLSPREQAEERLLMGLRIIEGVPLNDLTPLPLTRLPELLEQGMVTQDDGRLQATAAGRLLLDRVTGMLAE
ncbi:radical SAM family heme chaperone HemW [soil metagenome]